MLQTFKAELFKALGHPVRIRMLELLRAGEKTVSELHTELEIDPSSASQQLSVLRTRQLVAGRKQGTSVYYRVTDARVYELLDTARAMFDRQLESLQAMAQEDDALSAEAENDDSSAPRT